MTIKELIIEEMNFLCLMRDILKAKGKSVGTINELRGMMHYGYSPEIESDITGETDAEWVRLNYGDCYLFILDDGTEWYQYDPVGCYGAELIDVKSYDDFIKALSELDENLIVEAL